MKSKVELLEQDDVTFPQMYQGKSGTIVLFTNKTTGTVVSENSRWSPLGFHTDSWAPCNSKEHWTRLPAGSKITLIQEDTH